MKKRCFTLAVIAVLILGQTASADVTLPVTAVSFPKEVIPVEAGKIEFWAKLSGFAGGIEVGGYDPHFFQIHDGSSTFHAGFNANDGVANGGLVGVAGFQFHTGSGGAASTYEDIFGTGHVGEWHHYVFQWNKNGIPGVDNGQQKVAIFVDGVLNSGSWHGAGTFVPLTGGTLNLITTAGPPPLSPGEVAIDELKIYDGDNNLILWNTLGSAEEIAQSAVGLNGSFNGGGGAHFVSGISGNAVMASPVSGFGPSNRRPVASCKNVTVAAKSDCTANASIDRGSFDPDPGDTITLTQNPPGPYGLGVTTVTLTVTDSQGATSQCTATVRVVPVVKIRAAQPIVSEGGKSRGRFIVTRQGCKDTPLRVYFSFGGTARPAVDYHGLSGHVTIPAHKIAANIYVPAFDDDIPEPPETVTVTLSPDPSYAVGSRSSATVTINDND